MPTLIVDTNSWVTLAEANSYLDEVYGASAWIGLSDDVKKRCLISAYRWINRLTNYSISIATVKVKYAQIELAWYIYQYNDTHKKHEALVAQGVKDFDLSKFSESLSSKTGLPKSVEDLLDDYDIGSGGYLPLFERDVDDNE